MANGDDQKPGLTQAEKDAADRELAEARAAGVQAEGFDLTPEALAAATAKRQEQEEEQKTANVLTDAVVQTMGQDVAANVQAREGILDQSPEARQQIRDLVTAVRGGASEMEQKDDQGNTWVMANDLVTGESGWVLQSKILANPQDFELAYSDADTRNRFIQNRIRELGAQGRAQLADSLSAPEVALLSAGNAATAGLLMKAADNPAAAARLRLASEQHDTSAMLGGLAGEITSGATMGLIGRGVAGTAGAVGAAARAGYLGSTAAKAMGATQYLAKMPGLKQFLTRSATAAAATPLERGVAMRALNSVGKAVPLAAEAALGEMQVASAEAALNNSWATGSQLLDAATIGSVWGLGLGVGGAAMKKGFTVGIGKAREMVDNKAKEILNAQIKKQIEVVETAKEPLTLDQFEKRVRGLRGNEGSRSRMDEWLTENEGTIKAGPNGEEDWVRLRTHSGELSKAVGAVDQFSVQELLAAVDGMEGTLGRMEIPAPSTQGTGAIASQVKAPAPRKGVAARVAAGEASKRGTAATQIADEILRDAGESLKGPAKASAQAWIKDTVLKAHATLNTVRANVFARMDTAPKIDPGLGSNQVKALDKALHRGTAKNPLTEFNIGKYNEGDIRRRNLGLAWDGFDTMGAALQDARKAAADAGNTEAAAFFQSQIEVLKNAQLGTVDSPSIFGPSGTRASGPRLPWTKCRAHGFSSSVWLAISSPVHLAPGASPPLTRV